MTIEVDITHRCNLTCRHCNRLCNADKLYGIKRSVLDMDMRHINFLISEIKKQPKGSVQLVRILGGEPLLSEIIVSATESLKNLIDDGYIGDLNIVTNGTIAVPDICNPYIVYAPKIVGEIVKLKGLLSDKEVYDIKNNKHRNITISPSDFHYEYDICDRVKDCGIHYSVYGFSYTAPCFPSLMIAECNHKYFFHRLVDAHRLICGNFKEDVCSICNFSITDYKRLIDDNPHLHSRNYIGQMWDNIIKRNRNSYKEPDTSWINNIND